jgi:hypothetical protein
VKWSVIFGSWGSALCGIIGLFLDENGRISNAIDMEWTRQRPRHHRKYFELSQPQPGGNAIEPQHPLIGTPAISLRFGEPPSDEGTGGGQTGEEGPDAVAVVRAACVEVSGISPGNISGDWGFVDAGVLIAPVPPTADPFVVVDPDVVPDADPDEGDDTAAMPMSVHWVDRQSHRPRAHRFERGLSWCRGAWWQRWSNVASCSPALNSTAKLRRRPRHKTTPDLQKMKMNIR